MDRVRRKPSRIKRFGKRVLALGLFCAGAYALGRFEAARRVIGEIFDRRSARERYESSLASAGLRQSALVRDWIAAGERALEEAPLVTAPHAEQGVLQASDVMAVGYRVSVRRGQELAFSMTLAGDTAATVFIDVWQVDSSTGEMELVTSADSTEHRIAHRPRRDGVFIVRAQPELLRAGRFTTSLAISATLAFPVQGGRDRDIGSVWGDSRDGGVRAHKGIDIFAPRGTPVLAAAPGLVTRVGEIGIGGKVVWLADQSGNNLYYAHLDRWSVAEGARVRAGDTLGFVGNTGNARSTPPHLHFGVYRSGEGPLNPYWFVHRPSSVTPPLSVDTTILGATVSAPRTVVVRAAPTANADSVGVLSDTSRARVYAATSDWYRVRLPSSATGYVRTRLASR